MTHFAPSALDDWDDQQTPDQTAERVAFVSLGKRRCTVTLRILGVDFVFRL